MHRPQPLTDRAAPARYRFGAFYFDVAKRELRNDQSPVDMPARVCECLEYLIAHRERAVARDELSQAVFGRLAVSDGQLAQIVVRARRCVGDDGRDQRYIRTVPRYGFRWVAETEAVEAEAVMEAAAGEAGGDYSAATAPTLPPEAATRVGAPSLRMRRTWRLAPLATLAAVALVAAAVVDRTMLPGAQGDAAGGAQTAVAAVPQATLVLPARVEGGEDVAWARLGLMDFLAERLRLAGLPVPPSENTLTLLGSGDEPDAEALRRTAGAALVVTSHAKRAARKWQVDLQAIAADDLRHLAAGAHADLLQAMRLACDRLLASLGRAAPADTSRALDPDERLQRVKAAMLANELETARSILLSAPDSQLTQPELRYQLARIDYRGGRFEAALGALDSLLTAPDAVADALFRARVLIARGGVHFRRNALLEAEADFDAALRAIEGRNRDVELGQALNGRGVARAASGREAEGIADLAAARLHLQRAGDRVAVARADANLGVIEMVRGRPAQARDYLESALAIFEQTAAVHERLVTLSALSAVHLQRLDAQAALDAANRAARLLPRVSDHSLRLAAHLDRANALTALGRFSDARRALEDPAIAAPAPAPYEHRRAQSRVDLAFHSGDPHEAVAIADAALADWTPLPADDVHDWVRLRRAQAAARAGLPAAAPDAASPPGKASVPALLTTALKRGERGGEAALRQALALAERRGAPAEIVAAAGAYVPWLIARGRLDEAAVVVGRIVPWTGRWYECALLQLQLAEALGDPAMIAEAQGHARTLAGERRLPDDRLAGRSGS